MKNTKLEDRKAGAIFWSQVRYSMGSSAAPSRLSYQLSLLVAE